MRDIGVGQNNWFERKSAMQVAYALYGTKWGGNLVLSAAEFCFCWGGHTWQKTTGCASAGPREYVIRAHVHMHARIRSGSKLLCREIFCFSRETTQVLAFDGVSTFELCWLGLRPRQHNSKVSSDPIESNCMLLMRYVNM